VHLAKVGQFGLKQNVKDYSVKQTKSFAQVIQHFRTYYIP